MLNSDSGEKYIFLYLCIYLEIMKKVTDNYTNILQQNDIFSSYVKQCHNIDFFLHLYNATEKHSEFFLSQKEYIKAQKQCPFCYFTKRLRTSRYFLLQQTFNEKQISKNGTLTCYTKQNKNPWTE